MTGGVLGLEILLARDSLGLADPSSLLLSSSELTGQVLTLLWQVGVGVGIGWGTG